MPLEHYVSQVHLRNFYSPALGGKMYAMRKSDLKSFRCDSRSVCRIEDGSTNTYLTEERAIEEFLKGVEPNYNTSLDKLRAGKVDQQCILSIAGFVAYVATCSPAAMRINSGPLHGLLKSEAAVLDSLGMLPKAPPILGEKSLTELIEDGTVQFEVDSQYPQAIGITNIVQRVSIFGNSPWEILRNGEATSPFFTSDYPVALEAGSDPRVVNKIVPLAPDLAIRISPDIRLSRMEPDLSFKSFSHRQRTLKHTEILDVNRLIVRCAEDHVFYRDDHDWVRSFIAKNCGYRVETIASQIPRGSGFLTLASQRVVSTHKSS